MQTGLWGWGWSHGQLQARALLAMLQHPSSRCLKDRPDLNDQMWHHSVAQLAIYAFSTMAQTGVSGPVVVDGESVLDALFASAVQDQGTRQHPLQVEGRRRRTIGWRLAA